MKLVKALPLAVLLLLLCTPSANSKGSQLERLYELSHIIALRSSPALKYATAANDASPGSKGSAYASVGSIILASNIHHINTILSFSTALIVLQENSKGKNDETYQSVKFIFDSYVTGSFIVESEFILAALANCQKTLPEPLKRLASETLIDFEECRQLILSYGHASSNGTP